MIDVVHPIALEWLQPDAAMAASKAMMPIEKLMTRSGRIAAVERAAVAQRSDHCNRGKDLTNKRPYGQALEEYLWSRGLSEK